MPNTAPCRKQTDTESTVGSRHDLEQILDEREDSRRLHVLRGQVELQSPAVVKSERGPTEDHHRLTADRELPVARNVTFDRSFRCLAQGRLDADSGPKAALEDAYGDGSECEQRCRLVDRQIDRGIDPGPS
jgi:hypothetical protein